jgi:hypothetical protein
MHNLLRSWAIAAFLSVTVAGCAPDDPRTEEAAAEAASALTVTLSLRGSDITVLGARASDDDIAQPPTEGATLRWEVIDDQGNLAHVGEVSDPRVLRSESGDDEHEHEHEVVGEVGTLSLTVPAMVGTLRFYERGVLLGEVEMPSPSSNDGISESALIDASRDLIGAPKLIHPSAKPLARILIVGDGYAESELPAFAQDADAVAQGLLQVNGYSEHADRIAIYRQDVKSTESGVGDPKLGSDPVTAFETAFGNDKKRARRCVMFEPSVGALALNALRSRADQVSADAIVILANTTEYGGCASPPNRVVTVTRHAESARILAHELGHSLFRLADEYDGNQCGVFRTGPNVATRLDALPWEDMLTTSTLPSPLSSSSDTVGAFLGANHCTQGAYRPTKNCMMRTLQSEFCPVCRAEIEAFFQAGPSQSGKITIKNRTGGGVFVRCADAERSGCSGWTHIKSGQKKTISTTAPGFGITVDTSTISTAKLDVDMLDLSPADNDIELFDNESNPLRPN